MSDKKMPAIVSAMAGDYMEMAAINFSMEFYNTYEEFCDYKLEYIENGREIMGAVVQAALNMLSAEKTDEEILGILKPVREELIKRMEILTAYTDYFQIHEYLLNRVELKFYDNLPEVDDDAEARRILQFIFEPEDNMEVNLRIKEMVSQMPVRMTTTKFYDLLKDSFTVYKGAEKSSLDGFVYMILSAAGVYMPENQDYFKDMEELKNKLQKVSYKDLTHTEYEELEEYLAKIGDLLRLRTEFCLAAQNLVNNLYTYYLVKPLSKEESEIIPVAEKVISVVAQNFRYESFDPGSFKDIDLDMVDEVFSKLEGKPEKLSEKIAASEGRLEAVESEVKAIDAAAYERLEQASKLMSSSHFVDFATNDTTECTKEVIEQEFADVKSKLEESFSTCDKQTRRAMMASVLKELPVFFVSHNEVMNYVRVTLQNCSNLAEKTASIRLFWKTYE
jgi:hypothetical protein